LQLSKKLYTPRGERKKVETIGLLHKLLAKEKENAMTKKN